MQIVVSGLGSYTILIGSLSVLAIQISFSLCSICFGSHLLSLRVSYLGSHLMLSYPESHNLLVRSHCVILMQYSWCYRLALWCPISCFSSALWGLLLVWLFMIRYMFGVPSCVHSSFRFGVPYCFN